MKPSNTRPMDPDANLPASTQDPHYDGRRVGNDPEAHLPYSELDPFSGKAARFAQDPHANIKIVGPDPQEAREAGTIRDTGKPGRPSFMRHRNS